jgi:hypothetical protein
MLGMRKKTTLEKVADSVSTTAKKKSAAVAKDMDALLGTLADKIADARSTIATMADDGATAARESLDSVVKGSKKGVKQLDKKWKKMEPKQKLAVAGAILAALAAAAATPAVVRKIRKRR